MNVRNFIASQSYNLFLKICLRVGKNWLFWFCEGSACVSGKTKCANAGRHKIELKKCAVGKIENTEGSAMSVGLLDV